jgi:hypothetical protein
MVPEKLTFSPLSRRQIEADFSGGHITSDAGLLLHSYNKLGIHPIYKGVVLNEHRSVRKSQPPE